ncbi:3-keto-5-aminohexanoate cleavage protein [Arcobacteraceae bacterium]|nr:3-keto-5-aminohexanoate cleavage protein [Arcobacteraceae bacterium]
MVFYCVSNDLIPYLQTLQELGLDNKVHCMLCAFCQMEIPSLVAGAVLGGHSRIGFENSRVLPNGIKVKNNNSQVQYLKQQFQVLNIG